MLAPGNVNDGTALSEVNHHRLRIAMSPVASTFSLTLEALGCERGSPREWRQSVRSALTPRDAAVLGPLFAKRGSSCFPDFVLPSPQSFAPTIDEELQRIADTPSDQVVEEIEADDGLSPAWNAAARNPRPWVSAYVTALNHAWDATRPLWKRAAPLMEREVERVGSALARGAVDGLFDDLHPRGHVHSDRLFMESDPRPIRLGSDVVIAPIIGGRTASFTEYICDQISYMAYPLPGVGRLWSSTGMPPGASLDALLGEPRAKILRMLDRPTLAGSLAKDLYAAPSAITHHLTALERAGLVRREREGRNVVVRRTARGTALTGLYDH